MGEQPFFIWFQGMQEIGLADVAGDIIRLRDIALCYNRPGICFGGADGMLQQIDAEPDVTFLHGDGDDAAEDNGWNHAGVKTHSDAIFQDGPHLIAPVVGEGDLHRLPDGVGRRVVDHYGAEGIVADGGDDANLHARIVFVHPGEGANDTVKLIVIGEVVCVIETDDENRLSFNEFLCDGVREPLNGDAGEAGLLTEEPLENGGKDTERGVHTFAVDKNGHHTWRSLLQLIEDSSHAGGLPGPGRPAEVGVDGASSLQCGAECRCKLPELLVAVVDSFGCIVEFKDLSVADECLVVHEVVMRHVEGLGWGVILVGWAGGENEDYLTAKLSFGHAREQYIVNQRSLIYSEYLMTFMRNYVWKQGFN